MNNETNKPTNSETMNVDDKVCIALKKYSCKRSFVFWCGVVVVWWCTLFVVWCIFTIRTDGTYFIFVFMLVGMRETLFSTLPIKFVGDSVFFTE